MADPIHSEATFAEDAATERCPNCGGDASDNWFDRGICPPPCDSMHTRCVGCGYALDICPLEAE